MFTTFMGFNIYVIFCYQIEMYMFIYMHIKTYISHTLYIWYILLLIKNTRIIVMICFVAVIIVYSKYYNIENVDSYLSFNPLLCQYAMSIVYVFFCGPI